MSKEIERAIHARLFAFPLRIRLGRKVVRNLADRLRKCDTQFAARIVITEQNISDCRSTLGAGKPSFNNSGNVFVDPIDADGPAV